MARRRAADVPEVVGMFLKSRERGGMAGSLALLIYCCDHKLSCEGWFGNFVALIFGRNFT